MGRSTQSPNGWPKLQANGASVKLTALANASPKNEAIDDFVEREITQRELTINEPLALPDLSAIRELLLREAVAWESEDGIGGGNEANARRTMQLTVARARFRERARESARKRSGGVGRPARRVEAGPHAGRASAVEFLK